MGTLRSATLPREESNTVKSIIFLVLVVTALFYAQRFYAPLHERVASEPVRAPALNGGGPARDWQQAPNAVMDMQNAIGGGGAGAARAARDAVSKQVGR